MNNNIVLIAMSGGVDSCVAAGILKNEGYNLVGVTMSVWENRVDTERRHGSCCAVEDVDDARRVAVKLGIPHYCLNAKHEFKTRVVDSFVDEYLAGRTPNPCVLCNQELKFNYLFRQGERFGAKYVATGHYARIGEFMGHKVIMRGVDREKDQSYFLFSTPKDKLDRILFPVGSLTKSQTRRRAREFDLAVSDKKESQDTCFIPDNDYAGFIENSSDDFDIGDGDIVDGSGDVIGHHGGYLHFTIGQRRGLGLAGPAPKYVTAIDPERNVIVAGAKDEVMARSLLARDMSWFIPASDLANLSLTAKIRYRSGDTSVTVTINSDNSAVVIFDEPQMAITPGQAVVIYHGEILLGGGWIESSFS